MGIDIMGNLNTTIYGCSNEEYNKLQDKLDKMTNKFEIENIENKAYKNSITELEKRIIYYKEKEKNKEKENELLNIEIMNYKKKEKNNLKENIFLTLKNNDLNIENEKLKNQIKKNELDIYNYDLNYKYVKFILKQQSKLNLKLEKNLTKEYKEKTLYL